MRRRAAAAAMVGEAMAIWNRRSRCQPVRLSPAARGRSSGGWPLGSAWLPVPGRWPGEVLPGQLARTSRGGTADAGHGDAVLAGDPGEESAGDAGLGFQLPEVLSDPDVLAFEELAGQDGAGALLPLPCQGRGGSAPLARGPWEVVEREPDMAGAGAQPGGRVGDGKLSGDDEAAGGVQVDVVRLGPGQVQAGAAAGGGAQVSGSPIPRSCRSPAAWPCSASRSPVASVSVNAW
jgi:hypothetical protein